ncbi:MAG: ABC transporter ATP-binding protein [Candidatus Kariarchaeaceae archaeon]|jgi:energy-coupling factor transport system ATP-binding protein
MSDVILSIDQLRIRYKGREEDVLKDISLELSTTECLVITGKIGSGKSTLLRAIGKQFPPGMLEEVEGDIAIDLRPGMVYQRPKSQLITFRVDEEIATPLSFAKVPRAERYQQLEEYLQKHDITHLESRDPRSLSSGEQQSVVILTTLLNSPRLILLDEPLSLLDNDNQCKVITVLQALLEQGYSLIIVDHNPLSYTSVASKLLILDEGRLEFWGKFSDGVTRYHQLLDKTIHQEMDKIVPSTGRWEISAAIGYHKPVHHIKETIPDRGLILITGPNGSGKTLLLRTIAGFHPSLSGFLELPRNFIFLGQDTFSFFFRKTVSHEWGVDLSTITWLVKKLYEEAQQQLILVTSNDDLLIQQLSKFKSLEINLNKED